MTYDSLFHPSYLKSLCEQYSLHPSKQYGQNFLISESPIKKMIEAAELKKTDTVVEIGPGFGVLTLAVAPLVNKVVAFEIERKLIEYWDKEQKAKSKDQAIGDIEIVWGNVINKWKEESGKWKPGNYKVLANLPYSITSNVLRVILESENKPERIILMVQKEVAERICAKPRLRQGSGGQAGNMSLLAVSVQYYGEPKIICRVPKGSFWPSPKVDSAIIAISRISKVSNTNDARFFEIAKAGFANKRKQLWRNLSVGLKLDGEKVKAILRAVCGNEMVRAQELGVGEWNTIVEKFF